MTALCYLGYVTLVAKLDREFVSSYELVITVTAVSDVESYLTESANLTVQVTDVNDNAPKFPNLTFEFEVC